MKTSTKWKHDGVFESQQEGSDKSITIDTDKKEGPGPKSLYCQDWPDVPVLM